MTDKNEDNPLEIDDDLLAMIQRWTEETQRAKAEKRQWQPSETDLDRLPPRQNPWNSQLTEAADHALNDDIFDGLPPLRSTAPPRSRYTAPAPSVAPAPAETRQTAVPRAKKKKKHRFKRFMTLVVVLALLAAAGGYALLYSLAGNVERTAISQEDRAALFAVTGTTRVTNILLLGVDTQGGGTRSDTMLLLSIDKANKKIKLTSFLRDSWLEMPNGKSAKLNTAIALGGPGMAMRAVSENFNVRADHYMLFSFDSFSEIIDALGGVAVPITEKEADFLCSTTRLGKQIGRESMREQMNKSGKVKLNGEQALIFCRIRKLDSDFERTERQRRFLNSVLEACKKNPLRLLGLAGDALALIETDMSQSKLAGIAASAPSLLGYPISQFTVPAAGTWKYSTRAGQSVITLDAAQNAQQLRAFIYE